MYEVFERLMAQKGVTPYRVHKETGVAQSSLSDWKLGKGTPGADKLLKIAEYFGVTIKYLLTGEESKEKAPVTSTGALREYFIEKVGREPTKEELERVDQFADTFIKGLDK